MPGSSRRHSTTPEYTCRDSSSSTSDRRHSTSSDTSLPDSSHFRQLSQENLEYIPTRMKQVTASKPAANPLQFVKVGPCGLYRSAQEQLKKVEEVKKLKQQVKEEAEDWQSNLDNWKSSRRKRQEHIIERVVEVKKLELEEFDRNRRRSKTFNEMMEERNSRGRKVSLVMYKEEDANDLSDLGIGTSSGKSSVCGDYGNDDTQSTSDREEAEKHQYENHNGSQGKNGVNGHREDRSDSVTTSSPEPEEYTYERAIQSYVDFTATRVKSKAADRKSLSSSREELNEVSKLSNGHSAKSPPPPPVKPRRESNPKIEGRLTGLEQRRRSSADLNSIPDSSRLLPLPKVDVLKRRELFEKASESSEVTPKIPTRKSGLSTTQTIKERLSNLEKQTDTSSNPPKGNSRISATEISSSLKERLSSLQKQKSNDNLLEKDTVKNNHRLSCSDISSSQSIRTRLSQLEKQKSSEDENEPVSPNRQSGDFSHSIKERLSNLDAACHKENAKRVTPDRDPSFSNKLANFRNTESLPQEDEHSDKNEKTITAESERSASPDDVEIYPSKRQQFHRSLDSLDVESSNDVVNEAFERVQSLEDLDCCNRARNYPASASSTEMLAFSSQSGDTDREDSGIHTADVSCSVSQADEPVEDGEIITAITSVVPHFELDKNGRDSYHLEVEIVNHKAQGSGISEQLSPIPQEDSSEACTMPFCHIENNVNNSSSVPEDKNVLQHSMDSNDTSTQADSSCDVSSQIPDISVTVVGNCDPSPSILVHEDPDTPSLVSSKCCDVDVGGGAECITEQTSASPLGVEEECSSHVTNQSTVPVIGEETNKLCLFVEDGVAGRECLTPSSGDGDKDFLSEEDITTSIIQSSEISSCSCTSIVMSPIESVLCSPDNPLKFLAEDLENIQSNSTSPSSATNEVSPINTLVSSVANASLPSSEPLSSSNGSVYTNEIFLKSSAEVSSKSDKEISGTFTDFHSSKTENIISYPQNQESSGDIEVVHDNSNCMPELVVEAHPLVSPINSLVEVNSTATGSLPSTNSIVSTPDISPATETVLDLVETEINMSDNSNSVMVVVAKPSNSECAQNQSEESQSYSELIIPEVVDSLTVGGDAEKPASSPEEGVFTANICPTSDKEELGEEVVEVCLRIKIPDVALAEKRKTVMEVCEKVDITQIPGGLKSPPPTPFISVPSLVQVPAAMSLEEEEVTKSSVIEDTKDSPEREIFYSAFEILDDKMKEPESLVQDGGAPIEETPIQKETIQPVLQEKPIAPPRTMQKSDESEVFLPISSQIPPLSLSGDIEIVSGLSFPLGPPTSAEPPKEKPPPPPTEASDEEAPLPESPLRRLDSTKRIKKEIRRKRSDFLGIEGKTDDDSYLEPELQVSRPPDINSFLVEERRLEQQLYRQSICSESDSNLGETTESRDSGVELERGHSDDNWSTKQPLTPDVLSAEHSRQNSELYGNASITSEEDEITKKEREIIEILEKEEQWRYGNNKLNQQDSIGEKLAEKLRQLEQEKMRLEWERTEEANRRQAEADARREEELRLRAKEEELRQQERVSPKKQSTEDEKEEVKASGENLRSERERLQQEQEALLRQKESLQAQVLHQHQRWSSQSALPSQQWDAAPLPTHLSLQDVSNVAGYPSPTTPPPARPPEPLNYRLSLPDLQQDPQSGIVVASAGQNLRPSPARRAPPPIPPSKPLRVVSQEQRERDNSIRSSRMPSADSLPHQVEPAHAHHNSVPAQVSNSQQMTRQTLQALSAVPRSRLINNDTWIQAKKKPESQRNTLNNQHWLIQEAEHRRITEQHQRNSTSPRKTLPSQYWAQQQKQPQQPQQPQQVPQRPDKPLPDSIIQTLTQRVQNRATLGDNKKVSNRIRTEDNPSRDNPATGHYNAGANNSPLGGGDSQEKMLSVSGKKKCSHCGDELGRGAAMIIESLRLFYHIDCFKCCVCHVQLGDGLMGTDVRVRNNKLHCHNCYSSDDVSNSPGSVCTSYSYHLEVQECPC